MVFNIASFTCFVFDLLFVVLLFGFGFVCVVVLIVRLRVWVSLVIISCDT